MYQIGQRWFSEAEPELGLGIISQIDHKTIKVTYPAANEDRMYGTKSAPLKRVQYEAGETIQTEDEKSYVITHVESNQGVLFYLCGDQVIPEMQLKSALSFTKPQDKLFAGNFDHHELYLLRYQSYLHRRNYQLFPYKGLLGSRVNLIAHQAYIMKAVTERLIPRVMLADEVGLGKTIEAGLILKSLIQKNRVTSSLVLVPDSLVYQWYFELLNKFNLQTQCMSLVDELELEAESLDEGEHYIISMKKIMDDPKLAKRIKEKKWDILIVDEAHQLKWEKSASSPEYDFVAELSQSIAGLILLSATPEMLGKEGHYSRLKLLDPARFNNFETFLAESEQYQSMIPLIRKILQNEHTPEDLKIYFPEEEIPLLSNQDVLIARLIDRHGTGRVYFRNTREHLEKFKLFFPKRKLHHYPIELSTAPSDKIVFQEKLKILIDLIERLNDQKILLLVHSKALVIKLYQEIQRATSVNVAIFHSGQSLMERDRSAAYFADPEGARLLLCTEIGSEGRNFEFAHHIFLFDLPKVPEQLEQRIGRLDRIGQTQNINIHVPFIKKSFEEVLFTWYQDVLESFTAAPKGATPFYRENHEHLHQLIESPYDEEKLTQFIHNKKQEYAQLCQQLKEGHDLLLDLNSFNLQKSQEVITTTQNYDHDLKSYIQQITNAVGIHHEDLNSFSDFIRPNENMYLPAYPALPVDGYSYTLDRAVALQRDDLQFMSWEHPFIQGSMDLFTNSEIGNMAVVTHEGKLGQNLFFEFIFKLEVLHGAKNDAAQFLPLTPLRVLLDAKGEDLTQKLAKSKIDPLVKELQTQSQKDQAKQIPKDAFKALLNKAHQMAKQRSLKYIKEALEQSEKYCDQEIFRLIDLQKVNSLISDKDISNWQQHKRELQDYLKNADINIDSIRLII